VGKDGAEVIQTAIENANKPTGDYRLCDQRCRPLFGASGVFAELQDALNTVWEVQRSRNADQRDSKPLLSFTMVLALAFTDRVTRGQRCINGADQFFRPRATGY